MCSCPSRTDEPYEGEGYNQSPNHLAADLTTNADLSGIANTRETRNRDARTIASSSQALEDDGAGLSDEPCPNLLAGDRSLADEIIAPVGRLDDAGQALNHKTAAAKAGPHGRGSFSPPGTGVVQPQFSRTNRLKRILVTYAQFVGPGFMIAVAYSQFHPRIGRDLAKMQ